jgi:hypothetical protein
MPSLLCPRRKDKLAADIADKANLLWNFDDELEDMKEMLEFISAALQDAERRSAKEMVVGTTVAEAAEEHSLRHF